MTFEETLRLWGADDNAVALILKTVDAGKDVTALLEKYTPGLIDELDLQETLYEDGDGYVDDDLYGRDGDG